MKLAVAAVLKRKCSKRKAAIIYGVPRITLHDYIQRKSTPKMKLGRKPTFTPAQEKYMVSRIIRYSMIGLPITMKMLQSYVFEYAEENKIPHRFSSTKERAGYQWVRNFLKRNPRITLRKTQKINPARASKLNPVIVKRHFDTLEELLDITFMRNSPEKLYNMDEKGVQLTIHHQQTVVAEKGVKRVKLIAPEHGQSVTVVGCGNACGQIIPPVVIFKGKRANRKLEENLPPGSAVYMAEKGSMTQVVFKKWLNHFAKYKSPGIVILIFDGAKCHLSPSIVDVAEGLEIILYCLPSNTTHELQPFDVSVFGPFEQQWDGEVLKYWKNTEDRSLCRYSFGHIFTPVWNRTVTAANVVSGFKACGIFPFNRDAIKESAFAPSAVTALQEVGEVIEEDRPEGSTSFMPSPKRKAPNPLRTVRKKSLNYEGVVLKRSMFPAETVPKIKISRTCGKYKIIK